MRIGHLQKEILKELYQRSIDWPPGWDLRRSLRMLLVGRSKSDDVSFGRAIIRLLDNKVIEEVNCVEKVLDVWKYEGRYNEWRDDEFAKELCRGDNHDRYYRITDAGIEKYDSLPKKDKRKRS